MPNPPLTFLSTYEIGNGLKMSKTLKKQKASIRIDWNVLKMYLHIDENDRLDEE